MDKSTSILIAPMAFQFLTLLKQISGSIDIGCLIGAGNPILIPRSSTICLNPSANQTDWHSITCCFSHKIYCIIDSITLNLHHRASHLSCFSVKIQEAGKGPRSKDVLQNEACDQL